MELLRLIVKHPGLFLACIFSALAPILAPMLARGLAAMAAAQAGHH